MPWRPPAFAGVMAPSAARLPDALPLILVEPIVRAALLEDLGRAGDITSDAVVPAERAGRGGHGGAAAGRRSPGSRPGCWPSSCSIRASALSIVRPDGSRVERRPDGRAVGRPARAVLAAERTALNLVSQLSGVATATRSLVDAIGGHKAKIVCTRKTTPGLRILEKEAVRLGGGANHRFGLDDAMLIKDNHVALAGGVGAALQRAREHAGHLVKIELEVDTLDQLAEALEHGVDAVLLDNMDPPTPAPRGARWSPAARSPRPPAASPARPRPRSPPPAST